MRKNSIDLSLYLVTQREGLSLEVFCRTILEAVNGGVSIVQLREKGTDRADFARVGKGLLDILRPMGVPLIINDSVEIAMAIGADGVHLGQGDQSVVEARKILGVGAIIGLSVETLEQAKAADYLDLDYIAASPVFGTPTKVDTAQPWGMEGLRELCSSTRFPVVSIGGINVNNVQDMICAGSSGVAVVSAIFNAESPREAANEFLTKIEEARKAWK